MRFSERLMRNLKSRHVSPRVSRRGLGRGVMCCFQGKGPGWIQERRLLLVRLEQNRTAVYILSRVASPTLSFLLQTSSILSNSDLPFLTVHPLSNGELLRAIKCGKLY